MVAPALRTYQIEAVESVERSLLDYRMQSTLVEACTGSGKTTTAAEIVRRAASRGTRTLVVAHRRELVDQLAARMRLFGLSTTVERGSTLATGTEQVVVSSIQTMNARLGRFSPDEFGLLVVDEAHHAPARGTRNLIAHFPLAKLLGLTATADRADGIALGTVFESVAARYGVREAIASGYLVPAHGIRVEVAGMDLSAVRTRTRISTTKTYAEFTDLHPGDLGRAVIAPQAIDGVVAPLLDLAGALKTVLFAVNRRHAAAIVASINVRRPNAARVVHGAMKSKDRETVLAAHQAGDFQFLVNVGILVEGYDDPSIACVALARPTQSRAFVAQAIGRGLRPFMGKDHCLVIDFTSATTTHDLVGPEDALAGAFTAPMVKLGNKKSANALVDDAPVATPAKVRWSTRAVKFLRGSGLWKSLVAVIAG